MKIFNWVHRRFHHKYEEQDATKANKLTENVKDKVALLNNEPVDNVFDGWKEGILAIGTFGFDSPTLLKDFEQQEEEAYVCNNTTLNEVFNHEEEEEEDMDFPLVLKACKQYGFSHDDKRNDYLSQCDEISELNDHEDGVVEHAEMKKNQNMAEDRVTLADLFLADSQKTNNKKLAALFLADSQKTLLKNNNKVDNNPAESIKKHDSNDEMVTLISNKKLAKDHAPRPIKKINRMVRKMLKKKIHPDVENQKEIASTKPRRL